MSKGLHPYEKAYIEEIRRDLQASVEKVDEILETDELDNEDTLVNAVMISVNVDSVSRRIQVVIDNINVKGFDNAE